MRNTTIKLRITEHDKEKFATKCGRTPMSKVLLKLIKQYIGLEK